MLPEPTLCYLLCQKQQPGWPVVDADKIAHELLADKEGRAVKIQAGAWRMMTVMKET